MSDSNSVEKEYPRWYDFVFLGSHPFPLFHRFTLLARSPGRVQESFNCLFTCGGPFSLCSSVVWAWYGRVFTRSCLFSRKSCTGHHGACSRPSPLGSKLYGGPLYGPCSCIQFGTVTPRPVAHLAPAEPRVPYHCRLVGCTRFHSCFSSVYRGHPREVCRVCSPKGGHWLTWMWLALPAVQLQILHLHRTWSDSPCAHLGRQLRTLITLCQQEARLVWPRW